MLLDLIDVHNLLSFNQFFDDFHAYLLVAMLENLNKISERHTEILL